MFREASHETKTVFIAWHGCTGYGYDENGWMALIAMIDDFSKSYQLLASVARLVYFIS